jgi:glycosyltransferase involved in cell wall biosynthesis
LNNLRLNSNRKIKIAHVITGIGGGAGENTLFTIEGLDKEKYHIDLVMGKELKEVLSKRMRNNRINFIQIQPFKSRYHFLYDTILLLKLIILFKKGHYDIVHTHMTKPGILGRIAARIAGVPIIIHGLHANALEVSDSKFINIVKIFLEKKISKFTDAYISVSEIVSQKYLEYGIGKKAKYFTVRSGMELNKFTNARKDINIRQKWHEFGINGEDFVIGNVGRLVLSKGHNFLFQAIKRIIEIRKNQPVKLLIIGDGKDKEKLSKYAEELNLEKNVIFTGYREDVEKLMALMDIFVLTSLREGLPRVLVQAAAVGIPAIAFNIDGVSEIIKDNYNGFLVIPRNVEQLTTKIIKYMDNKELILLHGQKGREFVQGKWSIDSMVKKTNQIYHDLIEEKITKEMK